MLPLVAMLIVASGLTANGGASAPAAPARVIDRTILCETGDTGGIRQIQLHVSSAVRVGDYPHGALIEVRTNVVPTWRLAWVGESSIELSPACKRSKGRVPLTSRGLSGGEPASVFEDQYDCWTPRRILIRVRAVFRSPVVLRAGRPYQIPVLFARGKVKEGYLAIRTQAGKPLVFGSVNESGTGRVFTYGNCFPD